MLEEEKEGIFIIYKVVKHALFVESQDTTQEIADRTDVKD
jgi:hypothetical protein